MRFLNSEWAPSLKVSLMLLPKSPLCGCHGSCDSGKDESSQWQTKGVWHWTLPCVHAQLGLSCLLCINCRHSCWKCILHLCQQVPRTVQCAVYSRSSFSLQVHCFLHHLLFHHCLWHQQCVTCLQELLGLSTICHSPEDAWMLFHLVSAVWISRVSSTSFNSKLFLIS